MRVRGWFRLANAETWGAQRRLSLATREQSARPSSRAGRRTLALFLLLSLACGGEPEPVPAECAPLSIKVTAPITTLRAHLQALPAWAQQYSGGGPEVAAGPPKTPLAQLRNIGAQAATAERPDGGPLICTFDLTGEGTRHAALTFGDGMSVVAADTWPAPDAFGLSVPGVASVAGIRVQATMTRSECSGFDPFFLLAAGVPIPRCRDQTTQKVDAKPTWERGLVAGIARCGAVPWADASEKADEALSVAAAGIAAACRSKDNPATVQLQRDGARAALYEAAAWVGWADPRVKATVAQLDQLGF